MATQPQRFLEATYRALCRHGYADLTVGDIAAEAERSKSLVHYYYGSKEHLFTEFLVFEHTNSYLSSMAKFFQLGGVNCLGA
ncbi:transcriptional regulator, TetR family [Halogranum amylolyticum]|uniref:Transcriptional regulator, TetR family n=1 Tax=Halogranum amylolyticum TaxID=660520 RepID=A0A1H8V1K1_9EURY|nr:transcriptional regulator, TetR family [Halogranum amylolyticum]